MVDESRIASGVFAPLTVAEAARFERALHNQLTPNELGIYSMIGWEMGWEDLKEERPIGDRLPAREYAWLLMACAKALDLLDDDTIFKAVAIELLRNHFTIHTDVQDGNVEKADSRPTVWWKWGPAQAINSGDGTHALARLALLNLERVEYDALLALLKVFDSSALKVCEGSYLEIELQERLNISVKQYLDMIADTDGTLVGCATALAVGGDSEELLNTLFQFGSKLGIARRIKRDMSFKGATDNRGPLSTKKKSLPVAYLLESGELKTKLELSNIYVQRVITGDNLTKLKALLDTEKVQKYCRETLELCLKEARAVLDDSDLTASQREALMKIGTNFIET